MILITDFSYEKYVFHLNGLLDGISLAINSSLSREFSIWLGIYFKTENTNLHWSGFLNSIFENMSGNEKSSKLIELLACFLKEKL